jgi:hypothetical protein
LSAARGLAAGQGNTQEAEMNAIAIKLIVTAAFLAALAAAAWAEPARQTGWKTYRSPGFGFEIDYPKTMAFYPGGPVRPPEKSMFPICDDTTVACFEYSGHALDRTQIQAMGLSVNVLRDIGTEAECSRIDTDSQPIRTQTINGIVFHYAQTGEAGLGSGRSMNVYRTLRQGTCFEVALVTAQSNLSAQDLKAQGRKLAGARTLRRLDAVMDRMLNSFAFAGPVNDQAGWSQLSGSPCGEQFEYPDNTTVETDWPSSQRVFNALGLSCLHKFFYRGRQYAVAAKQNLSSRQAMNAWLENSGFPQLDAMQSIVDGPSLVEYRGPDIGYFVRGSSLFLVTVTDGNSTPIPFEEDRVVEHLLRSFRVP